MIMIIMIYNGKVEPRCNPQANRLEVPPITSSTTTCSRSRPYDDESIDGDTVIMNVVDDSRRPSSPQKMQIPVSKSNHSSMKSHVKSILKGSSNSAVSPRVLGGRNPK